MSIDGWRPILTQSFELEVVKKWICQKRSSSWTFQVPSDSCQVRFYDRILKHHLPSGGWNHSHWINPFELLSFQMWVSAVQVEPIYLCFQLKTFEECFCLKTVWCQVDLFIYLFIFVRLQFKLVGNKKRKRNLFGKVQLGVSWCFKFHKSSSSLFFFLSLYTDLKNILGIQQNDTLVRFQ